MLAQKQIRTFKRGRINAAQEVRRQLRIRTNLERQYFRRLDTLIRKWVGVRAGLYREYGIYEPDVATRALLEELEPITLQHYRRVFRTIIRSNNEVYDRAVKDDDILILGRLHDFEGMVTTYFMSRRLLLTGLSDRMSTRISNIIRKGRADEMTLPQISKKISDDLRPVSKSRAALIARTETHNAASFANHRYHTQVKDDLGITMVKRWTAVNDGRTRSAHSLANGQTVPMDSKFNVGGSLMDYAGDPAGGASNTVNCRCVIIYADEEDQIA